MTVEQPVSAGASTAAARHDAMVAAYAAQRAQFAGAGKDAWSGCAQSFKADPRRELDSLLSTFASYLQPGDVLIDVGGGGGRMSLPLARLCREVINVDPSPAMREVFEETAREAGIDNVRFIQSGWTEVDGVEGDVALVAHVTYFVPAIALFVERLQQTVRRRVLVNVRSVPPPNQVAEVFRLAHNEELAPVPGHEELLAALEELGIAAEMIDAGPGRPPATMPIGATREDAVRLELESATRAGWLKPEEHERLGKQIAERFDELFAETERGFWRRSALDARELLITWETS